MDLIQKGFFRKRRINDAKTTTAKMGIGKSTSALLIVVVVLLAQLDIGLGLGVPARTCGTYTNKRTRGAKIVGGTNCFEGEFPWMVSFKSKYSHFCGGFIISERFVLTAAHCFWESANRYLEYSNGKVVFSSFKTTIGEFSLKSKEEVEDVVIEVEDVLVHPGYNTENRENDIALIKLKNPISIHPKALPVCLPGNRQAENSYANRSVTTAGWGAVYFGQDFYEWDDSVDALSKVQVKVWDLNKCRQAYSSSRKFPSKSFICAGENGKDSCTGDSGGPLMLLENNKWTAIGIVSVGRRCAKSGLPGVYTDISEFTDWIEENSN